MTIDARASACPSSSIGALVFPSAFDSHTAYGPWLSDHYVHRTSTGVLSHCVEGPMVVASDDVVLDAVPDTPDLPASGYPVATAELPELFYDNLR